jgi:hypothetical protein
MVDNAFKYPSVFGLLRYFDYYLSGLEKAGKGKCLLTFDQIYDFRWEMFFQYSHLILIRVFPPSYTKKWEIIAANRSADTCWFSIRKRLGHGYTHMKVNAHKENLFIKLRINQII